MISGRLPESTARVMALLRCLLLAPLAVLAAIVHELEGDGSRYMVVLAVFVLWSVVTTWWAFARPTPGWVGPTGVFVDLAFFIVMAASSAGVTSYITPVFYLYPIFTVFLYRPWITAAVGAVVAGGYALVWLDNLAVRGGPGHSGVVWMHFLLLVWMAVGTTVLALVLAHRARQDAAARAAQESLTAQVIAADHRASTRLADDLHDGPLQDVIAVRRILESLADDAPHPERVAEAARILAQTTDALRGTVGTLHPQVLRQLGLDAALRELAREATTSGEARVVAAVEPLPPLTDEQEFVLFSATRELISNARRHARATLITVIVTSDDGAVHLRVDDDGAGMPAGGPSSGDLVREGHIGLASHTLRIESVGGTLTHSSGARGGTSALVTIPVSGAPLRGGVPDRTQTWSIG